MIYLWTGNGGGKTTNALGIALRMIGHGKKVLMIQFLKWNKEIGEYKFHEYTNNSGEMKYDVFQFGREGWHGFNNLTNLDHKACSDALKFTLEQIGKFDYDLLILDEINLAVYLKLLSVDKVINFINEIERKYPDIDIVFTGRHASQELIDIADFVNEIKEVKSPKEMVCKEGIQW